MVRGRRQLLLNIRFENGNWEMELLNIHQGGSRPRLHSLRGLIKIRNRKIEVIEAWLFRLFREIGFGSIISLKREDILNSTISCS